MTLLNAWEDFVENGKVKEGQWELPKDTGMGKFIDNWNKFWDIIFHPIKIWQGFVAISFWVCLIACMFSIFYLFLGGGQKAIRLFGLSFGIFLLIEIINFAAISV